MKPLPSLEVHIRWIISFNVFSARLFNFGLGYRAENKVKIALTKYN